MENRGLNAVRGYTLHHPPISAAFSSCAASAPAAVDRSRGHQSDGPDTDRDHRATEDSRQVVGTIIGQNAVQRTGAFEGDAGPSSAATYHAVVQVTQPPQNQASSTSNAMRPNNAGGERRGLFFDDLGSYSRYPRGLVATPVVRPNIAQAMEGDSYAIKMQILVENEEFQIHAFDAQTSEFHQAAALGHRELHQHLCLLLCQRAEQDLRQNRLPDVNAVRFLKNPTRPPLHEVTNHFRGCNIDGAVWSYRQGENENDLTRNALLIIVFATPTDARNADSVSGSDPWFRKSQASMSPMGTSKKNPSAMPNWTFFNLCRRLRCTLLRSIVDGRLLAKPSQRMPPGTRKELEKKGAPGKLCFGNSLNRPNQRPAIDEAPVTGSVTQRPTFAAHGRPAASEQYPRTAHAIAPKPSRYALSTNVPLKPATRPQVDERQAAILYDLVADSLESFFKAYAGSDECGIWESEAMTILLNEALLRHTPLKDLVKTVLSANGGRGREFYELWQSAQSGSNTIYGTAVQRDMPVFTNPAEYDGGVGTRARLRRILTLSNVDDVTAALQDAEFVAVSFRANSGFDPAVRLLSVATDKREFVIDLRDCFFGDARVQTMLQQLLDCPAVVCLPASTSASLRTVLQQRFNELSFYVANYLGAVLNSAYDRYFYGVLTLKRAVLDEAALRSIAIAMLIRRCRIGTVDRAGANCNSKDDANIDDD